MTTLDATVWQNFADAYGFLGNSLLKPMNQTPTVGLDPVFWSAFPTFDSAEVEGALAGCTQYAQDASSLEPEKAVENAAVEFTYLFIGPPSPAAPPWETLYAAEGVSVGFGEATFNMKRLLREAGLEVSNENNQYADHLGLELLFLSELCRRQAAALEGADALGVTEVGAGEAAEGEGEHEPAASITPREFIDQHPLRWIDAFHARVAEERPRGYYDNLLNLAQTLLVAQRNALLS